MTRKYQVLALAEANNSQGLVPCKSIHPSHKSEPLITVRIERQAKEKPTTSILKT